MLLFVRCNVIHIYPNYVLQDWSIKYNQDEPVAPRYEVNAPDLYIPGKFCLSMSFIKYNSERSVHI